MGKQGLPTTLRFVASLLPLAVKLKKTEMYAHQVIDSLEEEKNNPNYINSRINDVIKDIKSAQHFHFNAVENVVDILNVKPGCTLFTGDQGKYITPPYELCWFDFVFEKNQRATKNGFLLKQVHPKWIITLYFEHNINFKRWVAFPFSFLIGLGTSTRELHSDDLEKIATIKKIYCKISDNILVTDHYRIYSKEMTKEEIFQLGKEGAKLMAPLNFALMLINCKNIRTVEQKRPDKLNKKRQKNHKQPLFSYYTLQLQIPDESKNIYHNLNSCSKEIRLHFCRGHFKTFTTEKPLFGKHVGRYWWTPQIKGNKAKGLVAKDYSINKNKI